MNLQGTTVKYHMFDEMDTVNGTDKSANNYQDTCPAIVLTDWNPDTDNCIIKALNLHVFPDCGVPFQVSSAMHVENAGNYVKSVDDVYDGEIKVKSGCWQMF